MRRGKIGRNDIKSEIECLFGKGLG